MCRDVVRMSTEYTVLRCNIVCVHMRTHGKKKNTDGIQGRKLDFTKLESGMEGEMKETTNIKIDVDLKRQFESAKEFHHKFIGDATELGMRIILMELKNQTILEQEEKRTDAEILALSQKKNNIQKLREDLNNLKIPAIADNGNGKKGEELEANRNERFSKNYSTKDKIDSLRTNLEKGAVNWERVVELYKFKNKDEAREWYEKKLKDKL